MTDLNDFNKNGFILKKQLFSKDEVKKLINYIDSSSKKITFKIDSSNFNENELKKLKNTLSKHKGSKPVYFDIYDSKNKYKLNMISEQAKVSITKELLVSLEQDEFRYKLN